jgi:hypothetical protein
MYARGFGYFDHILPALAIRGGPGGQRASYFCLENDHWRIIGLDTAYNSVGAPLIERFIQSDCALPAELIDWLRTTVKPLSDEKHIDQEVVELGEHAREQRAGLARRQAVGPIQLEAIRAES